MCVLYICVCASQLFMCSTLLCMCVNLVCMYKFMLYMCAITLCICVLLYFATAVCTWKGEVVADMPHDTASKPSHASCIETDNAEQSIFSSSLWLLQLL